MSGRGRSGNSSGGRGRGGRSGGGGGGRGGSSSSSGGGSRRGGGGGRGGGGAHSSSSSSSGGGGNNQSSSRPGSASSGGRRGSGRVGGGGGGNRRNRGRGGGGGGGGGGNQGPDKRATAAEQRRVEAERKKREEEEAAAAAKAEAERLRLATELERRRKLQSAYEAAVESAMTTLDSYTAAARLHAELRGQLDPQRHGGETSSPLELERQKFEQSKKKLKSDLKKCTAFVKKIKAGTYPTPKELEGPNHAIRTLNLSRYVEEVASALMEPQSKVKQADVPGMVMLCVEMHRRYATFAEALIPTLLSCVSSGGDANGGGDSGGLPRRVCFRLLTEFVLHGVIADVRSVARVVNEAAGVPTEEGKEYIVTDANLIVTFAKTGGCEVLGVVPRSVKQEVERVRKEVEGMGEGTLALRFGVPSSDALVDEAECEDAKKDDEKESSAATAEKSAPTETSQILLDLESTPFAATLSSELRQKCQTTIDDFHSTVPNSRAVPSSAASSLHRHCIGAYRTLSRSYVSTHRRLLKLEKRCEQDRLLQGNLSEAREKGLMDARSLLESLKKSVDTLSEALDEDVPVLEDEEAGVDAESGDGKGIELWTKNGEDGAGDEKLGPFDDEETRSFYCDVPDLLSTKPPALLGINPNDLEKQKERNLRQYGGEEGDIVGEAMLVDEVGGTDAEPKEEAPTDTSEIVGDAEEEAVMEGDEDAEEGDAVENKDTPHYKLMVLLEQELPEASRRETIDELADRFCTNHGSNAKSRKRLYKTLFLVPRTRLDLLPYWSRLAAVLDRVYSDSTLVSELEQQMHGQARFKKNQNIESRLRTVRYLGELTKFRVAPPIVVLRGLRRCLEDFSGYNIDVACVMLESCGRYLYRMKHTHSKLSELMDTMMRIKKARNLDERHVAMITSAFLMVNPPPQTSRPTKEVSPLEAYLRYLLMTRLEADEKSVSFASKQIQRMPWSDPGTDCGAIVCKYMLKACRKGRYKATKAIASLAANLKRSKPEVPARLIDDVLEEIQWFMVHPNFRDHQRTLVCARVLGELFNAAAIPSSIVFDEISHVLDFGHDIPNALRQASNNQGLFAPHGNISQIIHEDEELEEEEEDETKDQEDTESQPQVVSISPLSKYDPRVPCDIDPPTAVFRIKLVCTILETASSHIVTVNNKAKLEFALASLQRYLFTKKSLPSDVEFSILDLFDTLDSELKKISSGGGKSKKAAAASFVRYNSWLDAHQSVVAAEKNKTLDEARIRIRLLAQASILGADDVSIADGDLLDGDEGSVVMSDEEESLGKDSVEGDSDDDSVGESVASGLDADVADGNDSESGSSGDDGEESSNEEEADEIDEEAAESAYLRQLQDEEFESELRRLTMDALERGKVTARTGTGGKVSSQMPAAPEFVSKKPASSSDQSHLGEVDSTAASPFGFEEGGMAFKLFKRGNKGKQEEVQLFVPKSTNLARRATKQDDEAAKERDILKARVLQYEAESADAGGNVYLDETKLQVIRNRPLTMDTINKNFGKSSEAPYKVSERLRGRGAGLGRGSSLGRGPGRGRGRGGGRLFNPGRGRG